MIDGPQLAVYRSGPAVPPSGGETSSVGGIDRELATRIFGARERLRGFASLEDMGSILDLDGDKVERLREEVVFLPY